LSAQKCILASSYSYDNNIENKKNPFIREGRKAIPWYHPDFPSIYYISRMQKLGGPEGIRTPDLLHAMEALSQLRYRPIMRIFLVNE
jgi:hypothetical protein